MFVIEIDRHSIEILRDSIIIDGFIYKSNDANFTELLFNEFNRIYLDESNIDN